MWYRYISQRRQFIRSYRSGIGKTAVIFPAAVLVALGMGLLALGMVFYLRDVFDAAKSLIGAFAAVWAVCYTIGCLFVRPFFDRFRPRYVLVGATAAMSALALGVHLGGSLPLVFIFNAFFGFTTSLFWPPLMGWLSLKQEGDALNRTMGWFNLSWSAGTILSPFLAGWLSEIGPALPIYGASGLFLLTTALFAGAILALPRIGEDDSHADASDEGAGEPDQATALRYPAWLGLFTTFATVSVIFSLFPDSARLDLGFSKKIIGILMLFRSLSATIAFVLLGRTAFWRYRGWPMLAGQCCLAVLVASMTMTRHPVLLGFVLAGMGLVQSLGYVNSLFHGVAGSANRAGRMAIHESLIGLGTICGAYGGGLVYEHFSMDTVYLCCAGLLLAGVLVQAFLCARVGRESHEPPHSEE